MKPEYRDLNRNSTEDIQAFLPVFWAYWNIVNGEDTADIVEEDIYGTKIQLTRTEQRLYGYLESGYRVRLCIVSNQFVGFMVYHDVCGLVLEVRAMYLQPEFWNAGLGKGLVASLGLPTKKIIFQTRQQNPPEQFLSKIEKSRVMLGEHRSLFTWEIPWEE